jgi:hypothetical protein
VAGYFPLARWIAVTVSKRSDELQHLTLALCELVPGFFFIGSHMTTYTKFNQACQTELLFKEKRRLPYFRESPFKMAVYVCAGTISS